VLRPTFFGVLLAGCLVAGCGLTGAVTHDTAVIQGDIVSACLLSPLFKAAGGQLTAAVPAVTLPVDVVNAGVDIVCAAPAQYAALDAETIDFLLTAQSDTAAWVKKNLGV